MCVLSFYLSRNVDWTEFGIKFLFIQKMYTYKMAQEGSVVQCSVGQFPNFVHGQNTKNIKTFLLILPGPPHLHLNSWGIFNLCTGRFYNYLKYLCCYLCKILKLNNYTVTNQTNFNINTSHLYTAEEQKLHLTWHFCIYTVCSIMLMEAKSIYTGTVRERAEELQ